MNHKRPLTLCAVILLALGTSWAADEWASRYKAKCAGCHGASGEGKPAMKAPALKGTSLEAAQIVDHLTKGESTSKPPHNKGMSGLSADQAKAIAEYVKTL
jgi:mono/diheme cytochrome c family protein